MSYMAEGWHTNSNNLFLPLLYKLHHVNKKCCLIGRICGYLSSMPVNARDSPGTSRDKAGTSRDKQGHSLYVPAYPYLYLSVHVCLCLNLSVPVCPCLSLSVPVCLYICYTFMSTPADEYNSLHQYEHSYIDIPS